MRTNEWTLQKGVWGCAAGVSYRRISFPVGREPMIEVWVGT